MGVLDDPRTEGRLLLLAADFLTVLLLTAGSVLSFLSAYGPAVDRGAVLAFCVLSSAVSAAVHSLTRPWWSAALAGMMGLCFFLAWEEISPVLNWLGWKMGLLPVPAGLLTSAMDGEVFLPVFLLLCAVSAWTMGWMAVRVRRWYLAALLSFTPLLPAIQEGVLPGWGAMLAAFAGWGAMLLTALYGRRDAGGLGRARLLSLTGMGALILTLVMFLPREGYLRPQWATDARTSMIRGITTRLERFLDMEALNAGLLADIGLDLSLPEEGGGTEGSGGIRAADAAGAFGGGQSRRENLLSVGPRQYRGREIMTLETAQPGPGRLYLLGGTLGVYTGESWESGEELSEGRRASFYPALTAPEGADEYTMTIFHAAYQGVNYYPYRLTAGGQPDEGGVLTLPEDQEGLLPFRRRSYYVDYLPGGPEDGFTPLSSHGEEEQTWYRSAAFRSRYLAVPAGLETALEPLLGELGQIEVPENPDLPEQFREPVAAAARTAALLETLAVYDLNTPAMERGADFVEHFLTEGRGYCVHFATAGAMLLRMQGIPARYAAGYTASLNGQGVGRVLDSDAHAWVEIYLEGYGWYPVEMTPGYGGGASGVELTGAPEAEDSDEPDEPEAEEPPEEESPEDASPEELPGNIPPEGEAAGSGVSWGTLGKIALLPAVPGGVYALALLLRRRERESGDTNRSALRAYRRYRRTLRWGGAEDETLEALGRKARFSQHTLTAEEREEAWRCLESAAVAMKGRRRTRWIAVLLRPWL